VAVAESRDRRARRGVHPFDPYRDLKPVTELIAIAFAGRLDPAGQASLAQMCREARRSALVRWLFRPVWSQQGMAPGFVWVEDGRVVGNVSLRRALERGGFFVGNVSVYPDWRGRGIAGALMRAALDEISARGGRWVGLEVRADNAAARRLYERFGFQEVGRTVCMLRPAGPPWNVGLPPPRLSLRRGRSRDTRALIRLVYAFIPEPQHPLLELREDDYRLGWERALDCWLEGRREAWWVADEGGRVCGAVRVVRERGDHPDRLEVLVGPGHVGQLEAALVHQGLVGLCRRKKVVETIIPGTAEPLAVALEKAGFQRLHTLVQMRLDFPHHHIPVRDRQRGTEG